MAYTQSLYPIVRKQNLARGVYDYTVHCPEMAAEAVPGQICPYPGAGAYAAAADLDLWNRPGKGGPPAGDGSPR